MTVEREFTIGDLRRLYYNGRLVQDRSRSCEFGGTPIQGNSQPGVSPYDMKGVGELSHRYVSAARQDDT